MFQNRTLRVLLLLTLTVNTISAQTIMKVSLKSDTAWQCLSQISKLTFNNELTSITTKFGASNNYKVALIKQITFDRSVKIITNAEIIENNKKNIFAITPNPASTEISITFNEIMNQNTTISVYDAKGTVILKQTYTNGIDLNILTIDISSLHKGMYILRIESEKQSEAAKFIKL